MKDAKRRRTLSLLTCIAGLALSSPSVAARNDAARTERGAASATTHAACPALLDRRLPRLQDEAPQDLCRHAGQVLLVVNTASYCGFTRQYEGLERVHARYAARGFSVLGFPSNDFGQQEPGTAKEIADFCENTFGVRFPMFSKTRVTGANADPFFASLAAQAGGSPRWNFHKYLIGRDGKVAAQFPSSVEPTDPRLLTAIERALSATAR